MRDSGTNTHGTSDKVVLTTLTGLALAAVAVGISFLPERFASAVMQDPPPDVVHLTGTVRDFKKNHVDFNVVPNGGSGHYAMNVALDLGPEDRPTFRGTGFRVDTQWRDGVSNPIAPHLYGGGVGMVKLASAPTLSPAATVDTWDSDIGPYGPGNMGPAPSFYAGAEMPVVTVPPDLIVMINEEIVTYKDGGTMPRSTDLHCDTLSIHDPGTTLEIDGNVRILCETMFEMRDGSSIAFTPGSTLVIYTMGDVSLVDATINSSGFDPDAFTIYHLGSNPMRIGDDADVIASIIAPNGGLLVDGDGEFFGTYIGGTLSVLDNGGFHLDESMPFDACGVQLNDTKGTAGTASTGGIDSADSFGQWYRDVLGMNLSTAHTIDLVRDDGGIYEFLSDEFYPIDGQLHGNQGDPHNNYFTFRFTAYFTYEACNAYFFEFMGSDDAWLFIDRSMAIDLGGIIPGTDQHVDLDRLGLVDGGFYAMQFFYAHRNPTQAIFRVRTNVPLLGTEPEAVTAGFD